MVYQPKNPVGYKQLLTWQQSGQIIIRVKNFVKYYLPGYGDKRLISHLIDSARSVQRNIEEGYKRASTREYVEFLGFSRGSLEELKGDFEELKREIKEGIREYKGSIRENVREETEGILTLIYGLDCMFGRQIKSLEAKMSKEKTLPHAEMIRKSWCNADTADKRFWKSVEEKFGLKKDEKGRMIRVDKGNIREL
jgi:four helix bundle protein